MNEFLIVRGGVDREDRMPTIEPGPFLAAARKARLARRVNSPRRCRVTRRLRKTRMCADPHDVVDPMRAPDGLKRRTENPFNVNVGSRSQHHGKSIACDPATHCVNRQNLFQALCDGDDKFVTAHHAMMSRDVLHAI